MRRGERWSRSFLNVLARRPGGSTARRMLGSAILALQGALLVSCGGEPRLAPQIDTSPAATIQISSVPGATPRAIAASSLGQVVWTAATDQTTNAPTEPVSSYVADAPRIIAAVPARSLPAGSRIEATWEYNDTSLDAFTTKLFQTEVIDQTWITFHIERDPDVRWPVGRYEVSVSLSGTTMQQAAVEVSE
jgi:hypothetical protein